MRPASVRPKIGSSLLFAAIFFPLVVQTSFPCSVVGQVVRGRLLDSESNRPIINGTVTLLDSLGVAVSRTLSDSDGKFELAGPYPGRYSIRAKGVGYAGFPVQIILPRDSAVTADVFLRPDPLLMEPLLVSAERVRTELEKQGFYRRMAKKTGFFMTPEYLKRRPPITEAEVLGRAPFVEVRRSWTGSRVLMRSGGSACDPAVFVDNFPAKKGENIEDHVNFADIVAVEVFRGFTEIPQELAVGLESCGVVMIWTIWSEIRGRKRGGG